MSEIFLETPRLILKKMSENDFDDIADMLQNPEVMYAWEHGFSSKEVNEWIRKNMQYYEQCGYAYFLAYDKKLEKVVGQIALLPDTIKGQNYLEVGYIIKKEYWGNGYAKEGAQGLINYAFEKLNAKEVIAEIRPGNTWSRNVAQNLNMEIFDEFNKNVRGKMMLHLMYRIKNPAFETD